MPTICEVRIKDGQLFYVDEHAEERPLGIVGQFGILYLMLPDDIDECRSERTNCMHCQGMFTIGGEGDDDDRCGRCKKPHRECGGCDRMDAEVCIHCDYDWCSDCWTLEAHTQSCAVTAREVRKNTP